MKRAALILALSACSFTVQAETADDLIASIRSGDHEQALTLIRTGAKVNQPEANGTTALHWAVHHGNLDLVKRLIRAGAEVNTRNQFGASPVSEAAVLGNADIMQALLAAGASPESPNADGQTALMIVARSSNTDVAQLLLDHGADVNAREQWRNQNAVIFAAGQSQPAMLALLLEAGGDPNSRSLVNERNRQISSERRFQWRASGGLTALLYASREGCLDCVKLLLDAGADIDQGNGENVTPLLAAIINLHFDTARYLVESGANINKWSWRGENPLYAAVDLNTLPHGGHPDRPTTDSTTAIEMVRILIDAGANPNLQLKLQPTYRNLKDDRGADGLLNAGATALLRAAKGADLAAMAMLLDAGANPELPNRSGITPLMAAAGLGSSPIDTRGDFNALTADSKAREAIELMLAAGADINRTSDSGQTALHGAASWGLNETVRYLVENGADMLTRDKLGRTPLEIALGGAGGSGRGASSTPRPETANLLQDLMLERNVQ